MSYNLTMLLLAVTFSILTVVIPSLYPDKPYLAAHIALPLLSLACFFFFLFLVRPFRKYNKELRDDMSAGRDLNRNRIGVNPIGMAMPLLGLLPTSEASCCINKSYRSACTYFEDATSACHDLFNVTNPYYKRGLLTQNHAYVCDLSPDCGVYSPIQKVVFVVLLSCVVLWAFNKILNLFSVVQSSTTVTDGAVSTTSYNYFSLRRCVAALSVIFFVAIGVFLISSVPIASAKIFPNHYTVNTDAGPKLVTEYAYDCNCTFDEHFYAVNGVMVGHCEVGRFNNVTLRLTLNRSDTFKDIPTECLRPSNIYKAKMGYPICRMKNSRVVYDPSMKMNQIRKIPQPSGDTFTFYHPSTGARAKRSVSQESIDGSDYSIVLTDGFRVAYTVDKDYKGNCTQRYVSGIVPTVEGYRQSDCGVPNYPNSAEVEWENYVCTHDRREVYACEKGFLAAGNASDTEITCYKTSKEDILQYISPTLNPYTPNGNIKTTGILGGIKPGFKFTTNFLEQKLDVTVTYFETSQDNDQAAGQDKYFIYSFLTTVRTSLAQFPTIYARWINSTDDYPGGAYNAHTYSKAAVTQGSTYQKYNTKNIIRIDVPPVFSERTYCAMRQDYVGISTVYKSDVFNKLGKAFDPANPGSFSVPDDDGMYTFSIPVYIAARVYGPSAATILLFGRDIEQITLTNGLTDCVNCVKFKDVWYEPTFERMSVDVTVTGYPLTKLTSLSMYGPMDASTPGSSYKIGEVFQFYLTHPKMGAAMYLAKVSTTASLGKFSVNGPCKQSHQTEDQTIMCDGLPAFEIPIVKYTTFYSPLKSNVVCTLVNNTRTCISDLPTKGSLCKTSHTNQITECTVTVATNHTHHLSESQTIRGVIADSAHEISRGRKVCKFCDFQMISELYHRCVYCVIVFYVLVSFGILLLFGLLLLIPVSLINRNNLTYVLYSIGLKTESDGFPYRKCAYCQCLITSAYDMLRHKQSCNVFACPYCARNKVTDKKLTLMSRSYPTHKAFMRHMKLHKVSRVSPVLGYIKINISSVVAFTYVVIVALNTGVNATGLRNENIGREIPIPSTQLQCGDDSCTLSGNTLLTLPFTRGATFTLSSTKHDQQYKKEYTISASQLHVQCNYLYTASGFKTAVSHTKVKCLHTVDCNSYKQSDLLLPLAGGDAKYIPYDTSNPLKTVYCPTSFACKSPAVGFLDLYDGCLTVNDGAVVGYNTILPKIFEPIIPVFECTLQNYNVSICSTDGCTSKISNQQSIQGETIKFPTVQLPLDPTFRVGALIEQGKSSPLALYYAAPDVADFSVPVYSYRMLDVPQAELCTEGTVGPDIDCRISKGAFHYVTECRNKNLELNITKLDSELPSLNAHIPCSSGASAISWTTTVQSREVMIGGKSYTDTQTVARPSLDLKLDHCNMGYRDILIDADSNLKLDIVGFTGTIDSLSCTGAYNRNLRANIEVKARQPRGLLHLDCGPGVSQNCLIYAPDATSCNVTVLGPFVYNCTYSSDSVKYTVPLNCSGLQLIDPDYASYHIIGSTGSGDVDTWLEAGSLIFTNKFGRYLTIAGLLIFLLFLFWFLSTMIRTCRIYTASMENKGPYYNSGMYNVESTRKRN